MHHFPKALPLEQKQFSSMNLSAKMCSGSESLLVGEQLIFSLWCCEPFATATRDITKRAHHWRKRSSDRNNTKVLLINYFLTLTADSLSSPSCPVWVLPGGTQRGCCAFPPPPHWKFLSLPKCGHKMLAAAPRTARPHLWAEDCEPETPVGQREDGITWHGQHVASAVQYIRAEKPSAPI